MAGWKIEIKSGSISVYGEEEKGRSEREKGGRELCADLVLFIEGSDSEFAFKDCSLKSLLFKAFIFIML